jgi:hypothetical protein
LWDAAIRVPGGIEIGLDPLVGLVPGAGDAVGALVSGYIVLAGARLGVPGSTLVRMLANLGIDALLGAVPVAGDLFDVAWKSNLKNVALIEQHLADPHAARRTNRAWLALVVAAMLLLVLGGLALGWLVVRALLRLV